MLIVFVEAIYLKEVAMKTGRYCSIVHVAAESV
jgi:hypothetical protein